MYFNHKNGCQKCLTVGVWSNEAKRVYFPDFQAEKRTDSSFRDKHQPSHHKSRSPLEDLTAPDGRPLLNMIKQFPGSDPMHLLEEGVMKKCISFWTKGTTVYRKKWTAPMKDYLNTLIVSANKDLPSDIHRKLRTLQYISFWKATEFRTLLLYMGMVVLKDVLEEEEYEHFLYLSLAIRICSCKTYLAKPHFERLYRELLSKYCSKLADIYGIDSIVSNFHNISHVADDIDEFGSLISISTYPFENHLREIKLRIRATNLPIEQITRRIVEISLENKHRAVDFDIRRLENLSFVPQFKYQIEKSNVSHFKFIKIESNVYFSIKNPADRWFLSKTGDIVKMNCASKIDNAYFISGAPLEHKTDFFKHPYSSSKTDIYLSNGQTCESKLYTISEIKAKMICMSYKDEFVFIPLLHTIDEISKIK